MSDSLIIIPSRLKAKRLPNKPILKINGIPMIIHVIKRAKESLVGDVIVATPDKQIEEVVKNAEAAKEKGATRFCMGAAWRSPNKKQLNQILCDLIH